MDLPVTAISEWCNDKPSTVAKVLISIVNTGGDHAHYSLLVFKVVSELCKPLEIIRAA